MSVTSVPDAPGEAVTSPPPPWRWDRYYEGEEPSWTWPRGTVRMHANGGTPNWNLYPFVLVDDMNVGHDDERCPTVNLRSHRKDTPYPWPCTICVTVQRVMPPPPRHRFDTGRSGDEPF